MLALFCTNSVHISLFQVIGQRAAVTQLKTVQIWNKEHTVFEFPQLSCFHEAYDEISLLWDFEGHKCFKSHLERLDSEPKSETFFMMPTAEATYNVNRMVCWDHRLTVQIETLGQALQRLHQWFHFFFLCSTFRYILGVCDTKSWKWNSEGTIFYLVAPGNTGQQTPLSTELKPHRPSLVFQIFIVIDKTYLWI